MLDRAHARAVAALLLTLAACSSASSSGGTPSAIHATRAGDALPPCSTAVGGTDVASWRQVSGAGFSLCIPPDWYQVAPRDTFGVAAERWRGGRDRLLEWSVGPFRDAPASMLPYNSSQSGTFTLGSRHGKLTVLIIGQDYTYLINIPAEATAPELHLRAFTQGRSAREQLQTILQTARSQPVGT